MDEAMSEHERRYNEIEHELEAALAQLRTNPPDTIEGLIRLTFEFQLLMHDRTNVVLDALVERVEQLERRMESLGPPSP
jgi:BMFP domain-containing protein YqiC